MRVDEQAIIGSTFGLRYEVLSELGKGRSGTVYCAKDQSLERKVALKLLQHDLDETSFLRFKREAVAAACLNHPNIITVFDFGQTAERYPYLVMEFLDGKDLHCEVGHTSLDLARSIRIVSQVCLALGHAHKRGVVHRDLKPSNIMLIDLEELEDFVKIVDFGIAKRFDSEEDTIERLTAQGELLGTPAYMSPEQCRGFNLDARSDIYSLGCVLYKMLTANAPIPGTTVLEIIQGHVNKAPISFNDVASGKDVPLEIQKVIFKALMKSPEDRQQTMFEFRLQLAAAYQAHLSSQAKNYPSAGRDRTDDSDVSAPQMLAGTRDVNAQYELACRLERGDGIPVNLEESAKWMRSAAEQGHREAQWRLGQQYLNGTYVKRDMDQALRWLRRSAKEGYEPAQFALGQMYETGLGVAQDLLQAISWYQEAARQGNGKAEQQLSICFMKCHESGTESEGMEAWLRGRAQASDPIALFDLANYLRKQNEPKNALEIMQLMIESAQKGHDVAQLMLGKETLFSGDAQGTKNYEQSFYWLSQSAQRGNVEAMALVASCYRCGTGIAPNPTMALQMIEKAADKGNLDALAIVACTVLIGDGVPRNLTRGIAMLKQAAAENSFARWKLALCCKNGTGIMRDAKETDRWFDRSAEGRFSQGLPWRFGLPGLQFEEAITHFQTLGSVEQKQAFYWLGICYEDGTGVPRDLHKALDYYTRASQKGLASATEAVSRLKAGRVATPARSEWING